MWAEIPVLNTHHKSFVSWLDVSSISCRLSYFYVYLKQFLRSGISFRVLTLISHLTYLTQVFEPTTLLPVFLLFNTFLDICLLILRTEMSTLIPSFPSALSPT